MVAIADDKTNCGNISGLGYAFINSEGTPQRNPAETSVKLRDLPPIPPPDEDSAESGGGTVAMSLVGAVTPMSSLAPHVVEGGNVYIDHPLAMDPGANDTVMVENKLYAPS